LKITTDRHEASRGLFATAELLVMCALRVNQPSITAVIAVCAHIIAAVTTIQLVNTSIGDKKDASHQRPTHFFVNTRFVVTVSEKHSRQ